MIEKRRIRFAVILRESLDEVLANEVPDWLMEELPPEELERIAREAGLPAAARDQLLATALALHKALQSDTAETQPKKSNREIKSLKSKLSELMESLDNLTDESRDAIRPPPREVLTNSTGIGAFEFDRGQAETRIFEFDPDPTEEYRRWAEGLYERLECVEIEKGSAGRKESFPKLAALALHSLMAEHGVNAGIAQCTKLVVSILEPVRRQHGHQSKAEYSDRGDVPTAKDLVRSISTSRRSK